MQCEFCELDLDETNLSPAHRLILSCEPIPHTALVYPEPIAPPINHTLYFCCISCLQRWALHKLNECLMPSMRQPEKPGPMAMFDNCERTL